MRQTSRLLILASILAPILVACGGAPPKLRQRNFEEEQASNPLGPSYLLMPLPSEDSSVLGRILTAPPEAGRSLDEISRPNPCADKLTPQQEAAQSAEFNDARELKVSGSTKAMLGAFGFSADADHATHFVYKLSTDKRVGRTDTTEYTTCCQQKGCGYGFVGALVHGEGEYATGEETSGSGSANVMMVGSAQGRVSLKTLHKRKVKGYVAAIVVVTDTSKVKPTDPLGLAAEAGVQLETNNQSLKDIAEHEKVSVAQVGTSYVFSSSTGTMTENEFVRRYRNVTGSEELDEFEHRRNKPMLYLTGSLFAASAALAVVGTAFAKGPCNAAEEDSGNFSPFSGSCWKDASGATNYRKTGSYPTFNPDGSSVRPGMAGLAWIGYVGVVPLGFWFFTKLAKYNGDESDHDLTYDQAIVYRDKYNRALIKRTHKRVNSGALELHLEPMLGSTLGIQGTF